MTKKTDNAQDNWSDPDNMFDWKLPSGKRLGDAKGPDLDEAIAYYKAKEAEAEAKLKKIKQYLDSGLAKS